MSLLVVSSCQPCQKQLLSCLQLPLFAGWPGPLSVTVSCRCLHCCWDAGSFHARTLWTARSPPHTTATRTSTSTGTISEMLPTMLSVEKCSVQPSTHCLAARKRPNPHSHGLGVALWGEKFRVPPQPSIPRPCRPKPSTPGISKRTPQRLDLLWEMLGAWIEVAPVTLAQ